MNPWDGLAHFFTGLINDGKMRDLYRLILGCVGSGLTAFLVTGGTTMLGLIGLGQLAHLDPSSIVVGPMVALVGGLGMGMTHAGVVIYLILKESPAAKGVPLAAPFTVIKQVSIAMQDSMEVIPADAKRENK